MPVESTEDLMAECSSQRPASQEMKAEGGWRGGTRGEVFPAQVPYKYKERLGCFLGIAGRLKVWEALLASEAGLPAGQGVTSPSDTRGPPQPTLYSISSVLWFPKEGPCKPAPLWKAFSSLNGFYF